MNKLILLSFLSSISMYPAKSISGPHTGFSIGANLGYASVDGNLSHNPLIRRSLPSINSDMGAHSSIPSLGFFLGYGWAPSGIYFGFEIFKQDENIKATKKDEVFNIDMIFDTNITIGLNAKIGYLSKDALFFLKSGIVSMGNTRKDALFYLIDNYTKEIIGIKSPRNPWKTGFLIGIGIDYAINRNYTIGCEFIHEIYGNIKIFDPLYRTITYKTNKSTSNIRLKYNF